MQNKHENRFEEILKPVFSTVNLKASRMCLPEQVSHLLFQDFFLYLTMGIQSSIS